MRGIRFERARDTLEEAALRFAAAYFNGHQNPVREISHLHAAALDLLREEARDEGTISETVSAHPLPAAC